MPLDKQTVLWYYNSMKRYIINIVAHLKEGRTILTTDEAYGKNKNEALAIFLASMTESFGLDSDFNWRLAIEKVEIDEYPEISG